MKEFILSIASFLSDDNDSLLAKNLVSKLAEIASFDSWMLVSFEPGKKPTIICQRDNLRSCAEYADTYYENDPFYTAIRDECASEFMTISGMESRYFRQSAYYREYLETSSGFSDQVAFTCSVSGKKTCMLTLSRSGNFKSFRSSEITEFRQVAPLVRAMLMLIWAKSISEPQPVPEDLEKEKQAQTEVIIHDFGATALSPREKEIVALLLTGKSAKSIGRTLEISPGTVQCHIKNIYLKLGVSSRGELFGMFVDELLEEKVA